jgi:hypothetical protein
MNGVVGQVKEWEWECIYESPKGLGLGKIMIVSMGGNIGQAEKTFDSAAQRILVISALRLHSPRHPQISAFPETLSSKGAVMNISQRMFRGVRHANIICHTQQNSAIPRTPARQASVILWEISVWSWRDIDDWLPLASVAPGWGAAVQQNICVGVNT